MDDPGDSFDPARLLRIGGSEATRQVQDPWGNCIGLREPRAS